jgi:hypothetical protein
MNVKLLLADLEGLNPNDFNFKYAYNDRVTGKPTIQLAGKPLEEVLPTHKVCVSGYLMSKFGFTNTSYLEKRYGVSDTQFEAIINAKAKVYFSDGTNVKTPKNKATLEEVLTHIKNITSNGNWINDEIDCVITENNY